MLNRKWIAAGILVAAAALVPIAYQTSAAGEETPPAPVTTSTEVVTEEKPVTPPTPPSIKQEETRKPLNIATPGPIEHYIWEHDGGKHEVWHNLETGDWKIVTEQGTIATNAVYTQGYLYQIVTDNGMQVRAEKIEQSPDYTGKDSVFATMKRTILPDAKTDTYQGIPVYIQDELVRSGEYIGIPEDKLTPEQKATLYQTQRYYLDPTSGLPLQREILTEGTSRLTEKWSYDYFQTYEVAANLFQVPTDVKFTLAPPAYQPVTSK